MDDTRVCLVCQKDLSDVMGCYVFVIDEHSIERVPGLVCIEHGRNHGNVFTRENYATLTGNV